MAAGFRKVINMKGYDRYQNPHWQMVPLNGFRYIALRDGAGLTVTVKNNSPIITVKEVPLNTVPTRNRVSVLSTDRIFKITGKTKGTAHLEARSGTIVKVALEISVKTEKTVSLAFNFVKDNAGHSTRRTTAHSVNWISTLNWMYHGQTNIKFVAKSSRQVTVPKNLGSVVRFSSHLSGVAVAEHEWNDVTALGDSTADMNFFFVWEYEQDSNPNTDATDAAALDSNCIFEDRAGVQPVETLGHEIGHYLGCADQYVAVRMRELMYGYTDVRGKHIPKQDANIMNP